MAATANPTASATLSMKLLVDNKAQRVLYAEASKDVVDFLFSLLTLPVGTVVKMLSKDSMVGSIGNLYGSVEKLDDTYVRSADAKNALLAPAGGFATGNKLLQLPDPWAPKPTVAYVELYRCNSGRSECEQYLTKVQNARCPRANPHCSNYMTDAVKLAASTGDSGGKAAASPTAFARAGFVQAVVTYTVMDDLKVAPMSTISGITFLNTFGITDIGSLQEKTVELGYPEGLEILKASLQSKTVLTDVFLGKKRKA